VRLGVVPGTTEPGFEDNGWLFKSS